MNRWYFPFTVGIIVFLVLSINFLYHLSDSRLYMTYLTSIPTDGAYKPFSSGD
ncbi:hypothetical protein RGU11_17785 [Rossellomorea marisflavi]|uniref:hypothetical protein n=1 Tax=Rossellomorea marisflavi TaxID=189381 RepID=UPI0028536F11|nr:hypothetical protein [Rossellomorea marisflavi]MDR4938236.1 hypothetical protein [Rossellomorea marisflavi]